MLYVSFISHRVITRSNSRKKKKTRKKKKESSLTLVSSLAQRTQWFEVCLPDSPPTHAALRAYCILDLALLQRVVMILADSRFSRPALKKYIQANYKGVGTDRFDQLFNQALKKGAEGGEFAFPKGMFNTV